MRITKISVTNLFGIFNHEIPLNTSDRITIIHAPNGFGKTILLRMINLLFHSRYSKLHAIPFAELRLDFDDGSYLRVARRLGKDSADPNNGLKFNFYQLNPETHQFEPKKIFITLRTFNILDPLLKLSSAASNLSEVTEFISGVVNVRQQSIDRSKVETVTAESDEQLNSLVSAATAAKLNIAKKESGWLSELREKIQVHFIEAQRLINLSDVKEEPKAEPSVATYAEELAERIQDKLAEYAALSQSLDRTFPARLVQKSKSDLTEETLRNKLGEIENQRSELIEAGLLGKDDNADFQVEGEIDEPTKGILSVYIEDVQKKLSVFEDIAKKIHLFQRIINDRFKYKKMAVSKDKGFTFTTHDGNPLAPADLSSGEQHELVMLYELLFKVEPNSLILIDEPELSLHLGWQVQFLKDLQEITKLGNFDVLLATHSPDIISDRWDLTVELKGPIA